MTSLQPDEEAPPSDLRARTLAAIENIPQEQPPVIEAPAGARLRLLQAVAAVLAVAVLGLGTALGMTLSRVDDLEQRLAVAQQDESPLVLQILTAPDTQVTELQAPRGTTARVVWSMRQDQGIFLAQGLEPAPRGEVYALWLIEDQGPQLTGTLEPAPSGDFRFSVEDLAGAQQLGVTLEPKGEIDGPTGDILIGGELT